MAFPSCTVIADNVHCDAAKKFTKQNFSQVLIYTEEVLRLNLPTLVIQLQTFLMTVAKNSLLHFT